MTADAESFREDLAFMRALVEAGDSQQRSFGEGYLAAGLIYGAQMLLHAGQFLGLISPASPWPLVVGIGPTLIYIPILLWIIRRQGTARPNSVGRAVALAFSVIGIANLALVCVIGSVAWREQSLTTWLIYPCAVYVLQGAGWLFAWLLRRRTWLVLVAVGWFAAAIVMAASVGSIGLYVLVAGLGIWLCMALPGWALVRSARRAAAA
jgi:hypothetical protein